MLDLAIVEFFVKNKEKKLKKKTREEVEDEYQLKNWLPLAAKRAYQYSFSSHPCKFSHPSSADNKNGKTTSVIAEAIGQSDGFVRSGNVIVRLDALGNAAVMDVYEFLTLELTDGKRLIDHIEQDTDLARNLLNIPTASYEELRSGFMGIKSTNTSSVVTSSRIKQVYFPLSSGKDVYHMLSILTPSGIVYALRDRIQKIRFGEAVSTARDLRRKNEFSLDGFDELYDLSEIGYGGSKPQNISALNKDSNGRAYLLQSLPPSLKSEEVRLPTSHFFTDCIWPSQFKLSFELLHKWLMDSRNNVQVRTRRDEILLDIFNEIIQKVWQIRSVEQGWSLRDRFDRLPKPQKAVLDEHWQAERNDNDQYVELFLKDMARWIVLAYKKVLGTQALSLNDDELRHVYMLIDKQKEALL